MLTPVLHVALDTLKCASCPPSPPTHFSITSPPLLYDHRSFSVFMALASPPPSRRASTALTTASRLPAAVARSAAARLSATRPPRRPPPTAADEAIAAVAAAAAEAVAAGVGVWGAEAVPSEAGAAAVDGAWWDPWVWRRRWRHAGRPTRRWRAGGGGKLVGGATAGGGDRRRRSRGGGGGRPGDDGWPPGAAAEVVVEHPAWRWGGATASWAGKEGRWRETDERRRPVAGRLLGPWGEEGGERGVVAGAPMRVGLLQLGRRAPPAARLLADDATPPAGTETAATGRPERVSAMAAAAAALTTGAVASRRSVAEAAVPARMDDEAGSAAAPHPDALAPWRRHPPTVATPHHPAAARVDLTASPPRSCALPPHCRRGRRRRVGEGD